MDILPPANIRPSQGTIESEFTEHRFLTIIAVQMWGEDDEGIYYVVYFPLNV